MNTLKIESDLANKFKYQPLPYKQSVAYKDFFQRNIPSFLRINGSNEQIYTINGSLISNGYNRIVIGDYGAFVEFSNNQSNNNIFTIQKGQEYRLNDPKYFKNIKYVWLTINDESDIKIYHQKKGVLYADYIPNMYYVSVHEVFRK